MIQVRMQAIALPTPPEFNRASTYDDDLEIVAAPPYPKKNPVFCGRENGSLAAYATKSGQIPHEQTVYAQQGAVGFTE